MRLGPEETAIGSQLGRQGRIACSLRNGSSTPRAALTFDDGPDPQWTSKVLNALDRADVRATFFVIAPLALEHHPIVSTMLQAGHKIEFHCTQHVRHTYHSRQEVEADTREGLDMLRKLGVEPRL